MKWKPLILLLFLLPSLLGCSNPSKILAAKLINSHDTKYNDYQATGEIVDGVRIITLEAYQFYFSEETIVVNQGEKIKLIISAEDVPHGFEIEGFQIPGYDIDTVIRPGFPLEIEFTADEKGVWEFICSIYCGYGHSIMKGVFVVR